MSKRTKIATCCFCGTKAALRLDKGRHELTCASCGAPLRDLKMLPAETGKARKAVSHRPPSRAFADDPQAAAYRAQKPRKQRRRGRWLKKVAEELFDLVEDVLD